MKILIKAVVTIALLGFLLYRMDLGKFWRVLSSADWTLVLVAALFYFSTALVSVFRWGIILRNFDIGTRYGPLLRITLIGYFFNMFLPSAIGGDFFRAYYLSKREKRGMSTTLTTSFLDRTAGLSALLMIGFVSVLFYPVRVEGYSLIPFFLLIALLFASGLTILFNPSIHQWVSDRLLRFHLEATQQKMELVYSGLNRLRSNPAAILKIVALSLGVQLLVVVAMWVAALSIGIEAPFVLFLIFIPIVNLSVAIPVTINGVGLRESVYFLLFSQIGVPVEAAVTLSILNWVVAALTSIPGGIVYSLYKREEEFEVEPRGGLAETHDSRRGA